MLAQVFGQGVFGGLGYNIFNVALVGRAMMMATFPVEMTTRWLTPALGKVDTISAATALGQLKLGGEDALVKLLAAVPGGGQPWFDFFLACVPARSRSIGAE